MQTTKAISKQARKQKQKQKSHLHPLPTMTISITEPNFPSYQSRVYKNQVPYNYAFQNSLTAPSPAL